MFDLGGVVFGIDFESACSHWATHAGVPAETIKSRFRVDDWYERHERGEIGAAEYFDDTRENVDGARNIGMPAIQVRSIADIRTNVTEFLK